MSVWLRKLRGSSSWLLAPLAASMLVKQSALAAFETHRRAMSAVEVLDAIGPTFQATYPSPMPPPDPELSAAPGESVSGSM